MSNIRRALTQLDGLFGSSLRFYIPTLTDKVTEYDHLSYSDRKTKYAQHFLAQDTILHFGSYEGKEKDKKSLTRIFKELATHPVLQYIIYVNALESVNRVETIFHIFHGSINIYHTDSFSYGFLDKLHYVLDSGYVLNDLGGQAQKSYIEVYYTKVNESTKDSLAHELAHRAYMLVFDNKAEPYAKDDLRAETTYKRILEFVHIDIKKLFSQDIPANTIDAVPLENKSIYKPEDMGRELIAYYLGGLATMTYMELAFPGFEDFITTHTIVF